MTIPRASVIVPVRNGAADLRQLLASLERQTVSQDSFEVVIGDDGSVDRSVEELATSDGRVRVVYGPPHSSYAARNRAAALARGRVLAFCDADCRPRSDWLECGLAALEHADIVAGRVQLRAPARPTLWSLLDMDTFLDQERWVRAGVAVTANLFLTRDLFRRMDGFDESVPEHGDHHFVARCVAGGALLRFSHDAVVVHPTRDRARAFLGKCWTMNRWYAAREIRAGRWPHGLQARSLVPIVRAVRTRRWFGRSLRLDRRRLADCDVRPRIRDDLLAIPVVYVLLPYMAALAQARGVWDGLGAAGADRRDRRPLRIVCHPPPLKENPYQRLLYEHLSDHGCEAVSDSRLDTGILRFRWLWRARAEVDCLHWHWPQGLYRHGRGLRSLRGPLSWIKLAALGPRLRFARALGYRLVWTIHQVTPHDARDGLPDRIAARMLARYSHVLIAHDEDAQADVRERLPGHAERLHIIAPGSYLGFYLPGRSRAAVRRELGIAPDAFVFLCFGTVQEYKRLPALLAAFRAARLPNAVLVVAGAALDARAGEAVREAAAADARIKTLLEFVPDERVAELFDACDVAVLPRPGGTSGALVLALSLGVPVIAARTPAYADLTDGERAGWLFDPADCDSLRVTLERAARDPAPEHKARAAIEQAQQLSWPGAAAATASALRGEPEPDGAPAVVEQAVAA